MVPFNVPSLFGATRIISNLTLLSSSSEIELASSTAGITSIRSSCKAPTSVESPLKSSGNLV